MCFNEEWGVPWAELNRRVGAHPETVSRFRDKGMRPTEEHLVALLASAVSSGLSHLFTG